MSNESRDLSSISSHALDRKLHALRGEERNIQVDFLLHLLEFDTRRGWALLGHDSLWQYCRRGLGLLECAIWRRTRSMAILRRSPFVADYLRDGRITMTTLVLLEKVLTSANTRELFDRISHRNVREVEEIVAELRPRSDVPTSIRKLPQPARENREEIVVSSVRDFSAISENGAPGGEGARGGQAGVDETSIRTGAAKTEVPGTETRPAPQATDTPAAKPRVEIEPLARERYLLKMTVDREFVEALDKARSILSHVVRDGDRVAVLRRALDEIITRDAQRHAMKVERCEKKARESQRRRESSTRPSPLRRARRGSRAPAGWRGSPAPAAC